MRTLSVLLILAGIGAGAATAYIAAGLAPEGRAGIEPASEFSSGPQAGSKLPGTFEPVLLNTPDAGEECCILCKFGNDPVVMVFASRPSAALAGTIQALEKAAAAAKGPVGACVIVTETGDSTKAEMKKLAEKHALKHVVLGVIDAPKLKRYSLHPDAEATVLLYRKQVVAVNRAFKAGEWTEKSVEELMEPIAKYFAAE